MAASNPKQPESTPAVAPFDQALSRALDRATLTFEVALRTGDPNLIATTADELCDLEQRIEGDEP